MCIKLRDRSKSKMALYHMIHYMAFWTEEIYEYNKISVICQGPMKKGMDRVREESNYVSKSI